MIPNKLLNRGTAEKRSQEIIIRNRYKEWLGEKRKEK